MLLSAYISFDKRSICSKFKVNTITLSKGIRLPVAAISWAHISYLKNALQRNR